MKAGGLFRVTSYGAVNIPASSRKGTKGRRGGWGLWNDKGGCLKGCLDAGTLSENVGGLECKEEERR